MLANYNTICNMYNINYYLLCTVVNKAATQLSEDTPLTQDEIDALQKLIEGTGVNIDDIIATGQGITLEEAQQLLAEKGHVEDAGNLKIRLQESMYLVFHV